MQFDHFNANQDDGLMSIEDLKILLICKHKIESNKKSQKIYSGDLSETKKNKCLQT